jgi:hypothetical protein
MKKGRNHRRKRSALPAGRVAISQHCSSKRFVISALEHVPFRATCMMPL